MRKGILVPKPKVSTAFQTYRILDLYRTSGAPYLPCFDEENIPPYPKEDMLVCAHGFKHICIVKSVDHKQQTCKISELVKVNDETNEFRLRRKEVWKEIPIIHLRSQPRGEWKDVLNNCAPTVENIFVQEFIDENESLETAIPVQDFTQDVEEVSLHGLTGYGKYQKSF